MPAWERHTKQRLNQALSYPLEVSFVSSWRPDDPNKNPFDYIHDFEVGSRELTREWIILAHFRAAWNDTMFEHEDEPSGRPPYLPDAWDEQNERRREEILARMPKWITVSTGIL